MSVRQQSRPPFVASAHAHYNHRLIQHRALWRTLGTMFSSYPRHHATRSALSRSIPLAIVLAVVSALIALTACGVDLSNPPRLATATARAAAPTATAPAPLVLPAPTATGEAIALPEAVAPTTGVELTIWVNEQSPEHQAMLDELAAEFADRTGTNVAVQLVAPARLPDLVNTAVLSGTLPDLVLYPVEYTAGWVANGALDPAAANEVVDRLDRDTFDPAALELLTAGGQTAAIPSDGYHQLLLYRADWFADRGLRPPDTYAAMATAAEQIFNPEAIISGLVIPTESNLVTTHQAFEQIALANGCRLIDEAGEVTILDEACAAALEHYYTTINRFSPTGVQTDTSARNALLAGRTGMIVTSPAILPDLAGLNPAAPPTCPECDETEDGVNYLARNVGVLTEIRGSGAGAAPAAFGNVTVLGITTAANREAAQEFAAFWFEEGYERWLAVNPERKVPMRLGTADAPRRFIDAWGTQPVAGSDLSLTDIYGAETVARLRDGIAAAPRWGIREGQGALLTRLYEEFTISIVLQEMLSGYFPPTDTLQEAYRRTIELIPNYAFPIVVPQELEP